MNKKKKFLPLFSDFYLGDRYNRDLNLAGAKKYGLTSKKQILAFEKKSRGK